MGKKRNSDAKKPGESNDSSPSGGAQDAGALNDEAASAAAAVEQDVASSAEDAVVEETAPPANEEQASPLPDTAVEDECPSGDSSMDGKQDTGIADAAADAAAVGKSPALESAKRGVGKLGKNLSSVVSRAAGGVSTATSSLNEGISKAAGKIRPKGAAKAANGQPSSLAEEADKEADDEKGEDQECAERRDADATCEDSIPGTDSADVSEELEAQEFAITLEKGPDDTLGADIEPASSEGIFIKTIKEGLISKWNSDNPQLAVEAGDCIIAVNDENEALAAAIEAGGTLKMLISRKVPDGAAAGDTSAKKSMSFRPSMRSAQKAFGSMTSTLSMKMGRKASGDSSAADAPLISEESAPLSAKSPALESAKRGAGKLGRSLGKIISMGASPAESTPEAINEEGVEQRCTDEQGVDKEEGTSGEDFLDVPSENSSVPLEFSITVLKGPDDSLGVDVEVDPDAPLSIGSIKEGLISQWNSDNPHSAVKIGDAIIAVNDVRDSGSNALAAEIKAGGTLKILISRKDSDDVDEEQAAAVPVTKAKSLRETATKALGSMTNLLGRKGTGDCSAADAPLLSDDLDIKDNARASPTLEAAKRGAEKLGKNLAGIVSMAAGGVSRTGTSEEQAEDGGLGECSADVVEAPIAHWEVVAGRWSFHGGTPIVETEQAPCPASPSGQWQVADGRWQYIGKAAAASSKRGLPFQSALSSAQKAFGSMTDTLKGLGRKPSGDCSAAPAGKVSEMSDADAGDTPVLSEVQETQDTPSESNRRASPALDKAKRGADKLGKNLSSVVSMAAGGVSSATSKAANSVGTGVEKVGAVKEKLGDHKVVKTVSTGVGAVRRASGQVLSGGVQKFQQQFSSGSAGEPSSDLHGDTEPQEQVAEPGHEQVPDASINMEEAYRRAYSNEMEAQKIEEANTEGAAEADQ